MKRDIRLQITKFMFKNYVWNVKKAERSNPKGSTKNKTTTVSLNISCIFKYKFKT